ncbi:MAG: MerR family DNA-binding transcriptional regulator [Intrasporangium sp.]|uniref:MerR family transcriptional regulator n=1 Tax=Intrasporangium sp. TaxID=1925024 RepID=UPI00264717DD|nr:MerR family DNA-binding transcriptional regulator [Intrasporangium sp.]MDN5796704.1 MerR family DNA-binding transcriptional regulator [Intrasporangium sp.]
MTSAPTWTIAQIADEFGVTHRTVRHYEDLGLLSPERLGTRRIYHRRDRTRLGLILRGRRLGFPLEQIRTIVDLFDAPRGRRAQLEYVLGQIDERRIDLERRLKDAQEALHELGEFERRCRDDLATLEGAQAHVMGRYAARPGRVQR